MAEVTADGVSIPRDPVDTDTVFLIALQKTANGYCGYKASPVGEAKTEFIEIGRKALAQARSISNAYDPDAGDEENQPSIACGNDIWDRSILDQIDNYQNLTDLNLSNPDKFNVYAILFEENSGSEAATDNAGAFAVFRKIDITRPLRGRIIATLRGNDIRKLDDPLLEVSDSYDFVYTSDSLFVMRVGPFNGLFRSLKNNDEKVRELVDSFRESTADLSIADESITAVAERAQESVRFANRLDSVVRKYKNESPSIQQIRNAVNTVDAQNLIMIDEETNMISFDEQSVDDVLKLLNEDIFRSIIFNETYAASGKRRREQ